MKIDLTDFDISILDFFKSLKVIYGDLGSFMPLIYEFVYRETVDCEEIRNVIIEDLKYYIEQRVKNEFNTHRKS